MKIRFQVNQAEAFRRGIDCPKSIVSLEIDPATLPASSREIIARHLYGICVLSSLRAKKEDGRPPLLMAQEPTLEGLLAAIEQEESSQAIPQQ